MINYKKKDKPESADTAKKPAKVKKDASKNKEATTNTNELPLDDSKT